MVFRWSLLLGREARWLSNPRRTPHHSMQSKVGNDPSSHHNHPSHSPSFAFCAPRMVLRDRTQQADSFLPPAPPRGRPADVRNLSSFCHPDRSGGIVAGLKHNHSRWNHLPTAHPLACHPEPIRRGSVKDLNFHMTDQQVHSGTWPSAPPVIALGRTCSRHTRGFLPLFVRKNLAQIKNRPRATRGRFIRHCGSCSKGSR
jgi:hypothetical protein